MKYKFAVLALAISIPSIALAGVNFLNTDPVYVLVDHELATTPAPLTRGYRLEWNQAVGKFDLLPGIERRSITIEESMQPSAIEPQPDEPIYYGDDISV